jgi:hypothetical protein
MFGSQAGTGVRVEAKAGEALVDLPWRGVERDDRSGAGHVQIERVAVVDAAGRPLATVQRDDRVVVHLQARAATAKRNIIIGYIINDRVGTAICGENSCSVDNGLLDLPAAGAYHIVLEFCWPEIQPGEYTLTLGVGEGDHPLHHVIQCWAHNVVKLAAVSPNRVVHCLFNNPISRLEVTPVG